MTKDGGKRYVLRLRKDAKFHNGRLVTSRDVVFTFRSVLSGAIQTPKAGTYRLVQSVEAPDDPGDVARALGRPFAGGTKLLIVDGYGDVAEPIVEAFVGFLNEAAGTKAKVLLLAQESTPAYCRFYAKKDVDRTLLRAKLARTVVERVQNLGRLRRFVQEFRHRPPKRHGRWTMRNPGIAAHGWPI